MANPSDFFAQMMPYAQNVSARTGLDPRLVLAQAALETGYGRSAPNNNFFGIKSHGRSGGSSLQTQEFEDGRMVSKAQSFRGYETPEQSFNDYADFITSNPRYRPVLEAGDLEGQIRAMGASGYATDPNYTSKLAKIAGMVDPNSRVNIPSTGGNNMARQPQPVTGTPTMSTKGRAAPQAEEEKVPFFQRPGVGNALDSLAIALQGMTIDPNQGLMQLSANRIAGRREQAQTEQQQNRTADWLESQGMTAAAEGVRSGAIGARDALALARGQQQDPYSSIGKLQSDLAAGLISQEQYEIALQSMAPSNTSIEVGPDGQLRFVQGPGAQAKPFTEGQSKDNVYVTRAQGALEVLDPVADELVSAASRAANVDPTGFIRSRIQSPEFQVAQQAGNEFLQAILRKDTGAAITEQEQQLYGQTYLPQPGDSPQVLTEKKAARRRALDAIRAGMSPAQLIAVERGLSQEQSSNGGGQANAPQSGGDGFSVTGVID